MSNILVVEDDISTQKLICHYLKKAGYFVMAVNDGKEALEKELTVTPNLLVLDREMKDVGGIELVDILKSESTTEHIRVIMLTSCDKPDDIVTGLDAGADDYIVKPFDPKILLARVRAQLRTKVLIDNLLRENLAFKGVHNKTDKEETTPDITNPDKKTDKKTDKKATNTIITYSNDLWKIAKEGITNILFVCNANLFRSPVSEELFKRKSKIINLCNINTKSAGLRSDMKGASLKPSVMQALSKLEIHLKNRTSEQVSLELAKEADIILVMEKMHSEKLSKLFPFYKHKIFMLSYFREGVKRGEDIADPIGSHTTQLDYRLCCYEISLSITGLVRFLVASKSKT